jgi:hypothetical protein
VGGDIANLDDALLHFDPSSSGVQFCRDKPAARVSEFSLSWSTNALRPDRHPGRAESVLPPDLCTAWWWRGLWKGRGRGQFLAIFHHSARRYFMGTLQPHWHRTSGCRKAPKMGAHTCAGV